MKLYFPRDSLFWELYTPPRHLLTSNMTQAIGPQSPFCMEQFARETWVGTAPAHCWGHGSTWGPKQDRVTAAAWSSPRLKQELKIDSLSKMKTLKEDETKRSWKSVQRARSAKEISANNELSICVFMEHRKWKITAIPWKMTAKNWKQEK